MKQRLADWGHRAGDHLRGMHPAAWLTTICIVVWAWVFGSLGVQNQNNFGTWAYDMAIYDQGFWLVSRGQSFMTVRGLDFWGHHLNLIAYAFAPFYWLGAGPSFLYVVQAIVLALGAWPVYLIARDLFRRPWMGLLFAVVYLAYAPVQWISWAMFHPEALVITPFLFAWWFATREKWVPFFVMVVIALSLREDVALAVVMLGFVLLIHLRNRPDQRHIRIMAGATMALGAVWYLVATKFVIPYFNDGQDPFYISYFYGQYGDNTPEILNTIIRRPDRVVSDAVQHDRLTFYKQMSWPMGWLFIFNPLGLLMALPQLLASVITATPYARMIKYQYTSIMIAPMVIATIYGAHFLFRWKVMRVLVPIWLLLCAYTTNVAWAPSPLGRSENYAAWATPNPRHESLRTALSYVPDDASVSATYQLGPHLAHREQLFDWPNPFTPHYWGNDTCDNLPDPTVVDYLVLDKGQIGAENQTLFDDMVKEGGPFDVVFQDDTVIVAKRVGTSPEVDVQPQRDSCLQLELRHGAG